MKVCSKCGIEKEFSEFYKNKKSINSYSASCKYCIKISYKNNKEKISNYYNDNKQQILNKVKLYQKNNREKIAKTKKIYRKNNPEYQKEYSRQYYENNRIKILKNQKSYIRLNKEYQKEYQKEYRKDNKSKNRKYYEKSYAKIKATPLLKLKKNLRGRITDAFKVSFWTKNNTTKKMLGCNFETAHKHLERQFTKCMSWENHGEWHIDHIIPLASAQTEEELIKLCHYTNLQPLWAIDNLMKGATMPSVQIQLRI